MSRLARRIGKEIRELEDLGLAIEILASRGCGLTSAKTFHNALVEAGVLHGAKSDTVENWYANTATIRPFDQLMGFFEDHGLLKRRKSDETYLHLCMLHSGSDRFREHLSGRNLATLVKRLQALERGIIEQVRARADLRRGRITFAERRLRYERDECIRRIGDLIDQRDDVEPLIGPLAALFRISHWNDVDEIELKPDLLDLGKVVVSRIERPFAFDSLQLSTRYADILHVSGDVAASEAQFRIIAERSLQTKDEKLLQLLNQSIDYFMTHTELEPDEIGHLYEHPDTRKSAHDRIVASRCKACKFLQIGQFDQARRYVDDARKRLFAENDTFADLSILQEYIEVLEIVLDWNEHRHCDENTITRIDALARRIERRDPREKPLRAGLLYVRLEMMVERARSMRNPHDEDDLLRVALTIEDLLEDSVRRFCIFDVTEIKKKARRLIEARYWR